MIAVLAPLALILSACTATDMATTNNTATTTQQLGTAALKIAINAKCTTELNNLPAWKTATKFMTADQKTDIQTEICGCVSEKAPQNITAFDVATAAIDPAARTTIISNAETKTINACVAEAVHYVVIYQRSGDMPRLFANFLYFLVFIFYIDLNNNN